MFMAGYLILVAGSLLQVTTWRRLSADVGRLAAAGAAARIRWLPLTGGGEVCPAEPLRRWQAWAGGLREPSGPPWLSRSVPGGAVHRRSRLARHHSAVAVASDLAIRAVTC
jgi:hypothetical protein